MINPKIWIDKRKDKNGKVTLRLRWYFDGRLESLPLGVQDGEMGLEYAEIVMKSISLDIKRGTYTGKAKYENPHKRKAKPRENPDTIPASKLFTVYAKYYVEDRELDKGSAARLDAIASKLQQFLGDKPASQVDEAVTKEVVSQWLESASNNTIKSYLYYLKGCWDWAKGKYPIVEPNPWDDQLKRSKSRQKRTTRKQPQPFSIAELEVIIAAFDEHPSYSFYTEFVIFRANSGTRIGEAIGLKWRHLSADYSSVWIGESIVDGERKGTKTGKDRVIDLDPDLQQILLDRYDRVQPEPDDLVFPSPKGLSIDDHNSKIDGVPKAG